MNKEIFKIAIPAIVANITVPLLGLVDTAISGHMGSEVFIGAVAVGTMMFNLIYWNFGFLRMGTSGLTAQAYGRGDRRAQVTLLRQSSTVALFIALAVVVLQWPLQWLTLWLIGPSPEVTHLAKTYFYICVWGAPAILLMMALKGWLLGMQDSVSAMMISIVVNVLNIVASVLCVYGLDMGFSGIAAGTVAGEYLGLLFALWLVRRRFPWLAGELHWRDTTHMQGTRLFFRVNGDIFVRSFLVMLVMLAFIAVGARSGDMTLAVNTLMMQLFTLYSHFLDGVAFAGEALVGKYAGRGDNPRLRLCVRWLMVWGLAFSAVFTLVYAFPHGVFALLTSEAQVVQAAMHYRLWCALIPAAGMAAFVWDGVFIGLTRTRWLLLAVVVAFVLFFALYALLPAAWGNNKLWIAYLLFLVTRGLVLTVGYYLHPRVTSTQSPPTS